MLRTPALLAAILLLLALLGCATPGPPLPPSLDLPRPVTDLQARREGSRVILSWTAPNENTDKLRLRHPGPTAICRKIEPTLVLNAPAPASSTACEPVIATVPAADLHATKQPEQTAAPEFAHASAGARVTYSLTLPAELTREHPDGSAVFYVQPLNSSGRGAGFSNAAAVPLAPAYPPPDSFKARQTKPAIVLTWTPEPPNSMNSTRISGYRIARREAGAQSDDERLFVASDSPSNGHLSDSQFTWGKRYSYRIATVTGVYSSTGEKIAEVDGDWSQSLEENATDVFPPSQPSAVQAVFTQIGPQRFIDLT